MYRRPQPASPAGRATLLERREQLIAAASAIDTEQWASALTLTAIRNELRALRELLYPAGPGRGFRRPRVGGPSPIPPPAPRAHPLRGRRSGSRRSACSSARASHFLCRRFTARFIWRVTSSTATPL